MHIITENQRRLLDRHPNQGRGIVKINTFGARRYRELATRQRRKIDRHVVCAPIDLNTINVCGERKTVRISKTG